MVTLVFSAFLSAIFVIIVTLKYNLLRGFYTLAIVNKATRRKCLNILTGIQYERPWSTLTLRTYLMSVSH